MENHTKRNVDMKSLSDVDLEVLIARQTDELTRVSKGLAGSPTTLLQKFLEANDSGTEGDYTALLDRCADFLTFGAIRKCQKCDKGDLIFTKHGYTCNGMKSKWVPCPTFETKPRRSLCEIPRELGSKRFFATCNLFVSNRAVRKKGNVEVDYEALYGKIEFKPAEPVKRLKLKNGTVVDPDSGKQEEAHVYQYKKKLYSTTLNLVDVMANKNSFYTLQVLRSDTAATDFWLYTNSGRIGTTYKKSKTTAFKSAKEACQKFREIFESKTGNDWDSKNRFQKQAGKFHVVEIEYEPDLVVNDSIPSKLLGKVMDLMKVLFDRQNMKQAMKEFDLDVEKMPLGKISKSQLKSARKALTELENAVNKHRSPDFICGLTNKFFTLIPHSFSSATIPILDTHEKINEKEDILKALMDIHVAYDIMRKAPVDQNSFEAYYTQLGAEVLPVDRDSKGFKLIEKYARNTSNGKKIDIAEVFKVNRKGEKDRYAKFKNYPNRMFLWHGSAVLNFANIISQGLIITPTAATGSMFGRGLYFADMLCKSLNYCKPDADGFRYLVLCEVALGQMKELQSACPNPLLAGFHSVKGVGQTHPNPKEAHTRKDGVVIPLGQPIPSNYQFAPVYSLNYNEYIVYDKDQVNIQYLVKLKSS